MKPGGIVALILAVVVVILIAVLVAVYVTYKPKKSKKSPCKVTSDCPTDSVCENEQCLTREGGKCKKPDDCSNGMACAKGKCKYTDFVNKNKRVRFLGETRREANRRRVASKPGASKPGASKRPSKLRHLDVPRRDVRVPVTETPAPTPVQKPSKLRGVYDESMTRVLPLDANTEVVDMTGLGSEMVYLTRKRGNVIFQQMDQTRVVECRQHMDKILGFNGRLLGIGAGVMHEFHEDEMHRGVWQELTLPTRQIMHWSASQDGERLSVRDLGYEYVFDRDLNVVDDRPSSTVRFYGPDVTSFVDINEEDGRAVTCVGSDAGDRVTSAAFDRDLAIVVVDQTKRQRGIHSVHAVMSKIFYIASL